MDTLTEPWVTLSPDDQRELDHIIAVIQPPPVQFNFNNN